MYIQCMYIPIYLYNIHNVGSDEVYAGSIC